MRWETAQAHVHERVGREVYEATQELFRTNHLDTDGAEDVLFGGKSINLAQIETARRKFERNRAEEARKLAEGFASALRRLEELLGTIKEASDAGVAQGNVSELAAQALQLLYEPWNKGGSDGRGARTDGGARDEEERATGDPELDDERLL
jgi:hypothetical protein